MPCAGITNGATRNRARKGTSLFVRNHFAWLAKKENRFQEIYVPVAIATNMRMVKNVQNICETNLMVKAIVKIRIAANR